MLWQGVRRLRKDEGVNIHSDSAGRNRDGLDREVYSPINSQKPLEPQMNTDEHGWLGGGGPAILRLSVEQCQKARRQNADYRLALRMHRAGSYAAPGGCRNSERYSSGLPRISPVKAAV